MNLISTILLACVFQGSINWGTDFEKGRQQAEKEQKQILLNFSGSDWCIPCIRMHDKIFENELFKEYAVSGLVLVNADFPRLKKHALPEEQQRQNETLAEKYNPKGIFPLTLLLDARGNVVRSWEGFPDTTPGKFVDEIKNSGHAGTINRR